MDVRMSSEAILPRIQIRGLCKRFNNNTVLEDVDLDIMPGQSTTIIGMSGSARAC